MVLTQNGNRVLLGFKPREGQLQDEVVVNAKVRLKNDRVQESRITVQYDVVNMLRVPQQNGEFDIEHYKRDCLFRQQEVKGSSEEPDLEPQSIYYHNGVLLYSHQKQERAENGVRITMISKNEPVFAQMRQNSIQSYERSLVKNWNEVPELYFSLFLPSHSEQSESVLQVDQVPFSLTMPKARLRMLGLPHPITIGKYNYLISQPYTYSSLSVFERQVYMPPLKYQALTERRIAYIA